MKFSIIIPLYNKADFLRETIESVLAQSFQDFEIIIVDDGSTDDSLPIAKNFEQSKVKVLTKTNGGTASARNLGIATAKGTHLCFLDADDLWLPEFLHKMNQLTNTYPDAGLYGTAYQFKSGNRLYHPGYYGLPEDEEMFLVPDYFESVLMGEQIVTASSVCIPAAIFKTIGTFNEAIRHTEDQEMWNRIAMYHPVAFVNKILALYRQDMGNSKTQRIPKHEIEYAVCLQELLDRGEIPARHNAVIKKIIAANLIGVASLNLLAGDKKTAKKFLSDPRTNNFPQRKAAWEKLLPWPVFLIRLAYGLRNFMQSRR